MGVLNGAILHARVDNVFSRQEERSHIRALSVLYIKYVNLLSLYKEAILGCIAHNIDILYNDTSFNF
jgi:hypothetical protein